VTTWEYIVNFEVRNIKKTSMWLQWVISVVNTGNIFCISVKTLYHLLSEMGHFNVQTCNWVGEWSVCLILVVAGVIPNITIMAFV
jgi:hypothetical protein